MRKFTVITSVLLTHITVSILTVMLINNLYQIEIAFIHTARQAKSDCQWVLPRSEGCHMIYVPSKVHPKVVTLHR